MQSISLTKHCPRFDTGLCKIGLFLLQVDFYCPITAFNNKTVVKIGMQSEKRTTNATF